MTDPAPLDAWAGRIRIQLAEILEADRWRAPQTFDAHGPSGDLHAGSPSHQRVVSFASNDYLGLSAHPAVKAAARDAIERWGAGSGASRLVTGSRPVHRELEMALAEWKQTEAAVCFPTGFAANLGVLSTLAGPGVRILSDELNHASIIDGCRLSRAALSVYRHRDMAHLESLLSAAPAGGPTMPAMPAMPTMVVTDTVFSMDGDTAPLDELVDLCTRHGALLVLDEAHAVLGPHLSHVSHGFHPSQPPHGSTSANADDPRTIPSVPPDPVIVRVGTLSKTLGSLGGFVAASRDVVHLLVNRARPYIFSTASTPADAAAASAALRVLRSPEGDALVARLARLIDRVAEAGFVPPGHPSPIVPIVVGAEQTALDASAALLDAGLWVPAIRPPTVPVGTSRLRVTLSAAHSDDDVDRLLEALSALPVARVRGTTGPATTQPATRLPTAAVTTASP